HLIVFYESHLPAFSFNTLVKKTLGGPNIDPKLEQLFTRNIDPHETTSRKAAQSAQWPNHETVLAFVAEADRRVADTLLKADLDRPRHPLLNGAETVFTILKHETMHQETLLYI